MALVFPHDVIFVYICDVCDVLLCAVCVAQGRAAWTHAKRSWALWSWRASGPKLSSCSTPGDPTLSAAHHGDTWSGSRICYQPCRSESGGLWVCGTWLTDIQLGNMYMYIYICMYQWHTHIYMIIYDYFIHIYIYMYLSCSLFFSILNQLTRLLSIAIPRRRGHRCAAPRAPWRTPWPCCGTSRPGGGASMQRPWPWRPWPPGRTAGSVRWPFGTRPDRFPGPVGLQKRWRNGEKWRFIAGKT